MTGPLATLLRVARLGLAGSAAMLCAVPMGLAQTAPEAAAAGARGRAAAISGEQAARYIEACEQGLDQGSVKLGCQGALRANGMQRLERSALRTLDPAQLTLMGEALEGSRGRAADPAQAYRWYLLGAAQGSRLAMERLSTMYGEGRGVPADPVKAVGYARLAEKLGGSGSRGASGKRAAAIIQKLGSQMAVEELALADQFALALERRIADRDVATERPADPSSAAEPMAQPAAAVAPRLIGIPGLGAHRSGGNPPPVVPFEEPVR